jgi:hypothetical protein
MAKRKGTYIGFKKLAARVGSRALAAWIGRKKYGAKAFAQMAAAGRRKATRRRR